MFSNFRSLTPVTTLIQNRSNRLLSRGLCRISISSGNLRSISCRNDLTPYSGVSGTIVPFVISTLAARQFSSPSRSLKNTR